MAATTALQRLRVGWWAGPEPSSPLAALTGSLLRAEIAARCPGLRPVLMYGAPASWSDPGFTGEPVARPPVPDLGGSASAALDILVASGAAEPGGAKISHALAESGTVTVAVGPDESWGQDPHLSVGPPFAMPEPAVLAARHFPPSLLDARCAYLRVVEGLPARYVLVEGSLLDEQAPGDAPDAGPFDGPIAGSGPQDLELALRKLAGAAGTGPRTEVVRLAPGPLTAEDPAVEEVLRQRRAETEEGRYQAEDWPGYPGRARLPLRVTSPVDLTAAVWGAEAVVSASGALMSLAWALGVPHIALAAEDSPAGNFAAWTGDRSSVADGPREMVAATDNIFARRGRPPGLKRLEATLDQSLDEAAYNLEKAAAGLAADGRGRSGGVSDRERVQELEAVNAGLRLRLASERLRFGERAMLLEKTAHTTVESAIKAVHGQDVIVRRRLEQTEKEMRRLQEETALQQAELREIHGSLAMRALLPAREWYGRLRKADR
jgi:hypothetical protein